MTRRQIVETTCTPCEREGKQTPAEQYEVYIKKAGKLIAAFDVDSCDPQDKPIMDLVEFVLDIGVPIEVADIIRSTFMAYVEEVGNQLPAPAPRPALESSQDLEVRLPAAPRESAKPRPPISSPRFLAPPERTSPPMPPGSSGRAATLDVETEGGNKVPAVLVGRTLTAEVKQPEPAQEDGLSWPNVPQAELVDGRLDLSTVKIACMNCPDPTKAIFPLSGNYRRNHLSLHKKDAGDSSIELWDIVWKYINLPRDPKSGGEWPLHMCGGLIEGGQICELEYPTAQGVTMHRNHTGHKRPEKDQ